MKKKRILGGILCIGAGAAIGLALPVWFGLSEFKYVNSKNSFNQKMEEIENSSHYQQIYENDEEILGNKYNNNLLSLDELIVEKEKLGSVEYKMNYVKNYLPDEYEGILKYRNDVTDLPLSIAVSAIALGMQFITAPLVGSIVYAALDESHQKEYPLKYCLFGSINYPIALGTRLIKKEIEAEKSLKREPDDLPPIDLE